MSSLDTRRPTAGATPVAARAPTARAAAPDDYEAFCAGVARLCPIDLRRYKRAQMERRIRTHAARSGVHSLERYLEVLRSDRAELDAFLDRITINVSSLWRSPDQWRRIAGDLVPRLLESSPRGARSIKVWSAGCSIGAEAYTAAAVIRDAAGPGVRVEVLGTDIDRRVLDAARQGAFQQAMVGPAPKDALQRHFEPTADGWRASDALKRGVRFAEGDLLAGRIATAAHDLVLCRNTVIYFTPPDRDEVHARLAESLRPGGFLVVGPTERVASPAAIGLVGDGPFVYRREA